MEAKNDLEGAIFFRRYVIAVVIQIILIVLFSSMTVRSGRVIYVFGPIESILLHILPFVYFARFFCAKGLKKYGGYGWAKAGMIITAALFLLFVLFNIVVDEGVLNVFGHLYWICLIIQIVFVFSLCSSAKNYKLEQENLKRQEDIKLKYAKKN